jgi:predicted dehydrogenase
MNVLIIGLGSIAVKHINAIRQTCPGAVIFALRSRKPAQPIDDIINIYDLRELPAHPDFGIVCSPTSLHNESIRQLTALSIPLFIEKPPVNSLRGVQDLITGIEQKQLINYVACNLRFHPCISYLKNHILASSPRVNEVNVYCGSYLPDWRPGRDFREIYSARKELGGGVHLDLFHELDYACWIWGLPEQSSLTIRNRSSLNISAADYANYTLEYAGFTISIILNYYRRQPKRTIEVLFDDTTWTIDLIKHRIADDTGQVIFEAPGYSSLETYLRQMEYFTEHIRKKKQTMNTFAESIAILKIILPDEQVEG